jgi:hypothetical protein
MMSKAYIKKIRTILVGGKDFNDAKTIRDAWIDYGTMLLKCPFDKKEDIETWKDTKGLNFRISRLSETTQRGQVAAAVRLAKIAKRKDVEEALIGCIDSNPSHVITFLRRNGVDIHEENKKDIKRKPASSISVEKTNTFFPRESAEKLVMAGFLMGMVMGGMHEQ